MNHSGGSTKLPSIERLVCREAESSYGEERKFARKGGGRIILGSLLFGGPFFRHYKRSQGAQEIRAN